MSARRQPRTPAQPNTACPRRADLYRIWRGTTPRPECRRPAARPGGTPMRSNATLAEVLMSCARGRRTRPPSCAHTLSKPTAVLAPPGNTNQRQAALDAELCSGLGQRLRLGGCGRPKAADPPSGPSRGTLSSPRMLGLTLALGRIQPALLPLPSVCVGDECHLRAQSVEGRQGPATTDADHVTCARRHRRPRCQTTLPRQRTRRQPPAACERCRRAYAWQYLGTPRRASPGCAAHPPYRIAGRGPAAS